MENVIPLIGQISMVKYIHNYRNTMFDQHSVYGHYILELDNFSSTLNTQTSSLCHCLHSFPFETPHMPQFMPRLLTSFCWIHLQRNYPSYIHFTSGTALLQQLLELQQQYRYCEWDISLCRSCQSNYFMHIKQIGNLCVWFNRVHHTFLHLIGSWYEQVLWAVVAQYYLVPINTEKV